MNENKQQKISLIGVIPESLGGKRLDQAVSILFEEYSRSRLQSWIKSGALTVDGKVLRSSEKVHVGAEIKIDAELEVESDWQAENLAALKIIYEDKDIIVVDKPSGLVVHPAVGNREHTLLNALLYHAPELKNLPRAGVVHRLDQGTSGLLVIARNLRAHTILAKAIQEHDVSREYEAIVHGVMTGGATIDLAIGRHPTNRTRKAVVAFGGRPSVTHYWVLKRFAKYTHIKVKLETGRTHQIRVHLAHIGYPIVGDKAYSSRLNAPQNFQRPALHARRLSFNHPRTGKLMTFESPLPKDIEELLGFLSELPT